MCMHSCIGAFKDSCGHLGLLMQALSKGTIKCQLFLFLGVPDGSVVKNHSANAEDLGLIGGSKRAPEKEMATHSSILAWKNPKDRKAWWAVIHGFAKE